MHIPFLTLVLFPLLSLTSRSAAQDANTSSASPTSSSAVQVSTDGSCGAGFTCAGSLYGQCCSQHGFCGAGDAYCGAGCQADFGLCGSLAPSPPGGSSSSGSAVAPPAETVTVTRTITAFATGLFTTTLTITGAVTRTVLTTATAVVSRTEVRTVTQTTTTTAPPVLSTSVIYSVSTAYVTRNLTQVILETSTLTTIGCAPPTAIPPSTTAMNIPPAPSPTLVGSPATCTKWYKTQSGETCTGVASKNGITLVQLMTWNPVGRIGRIPVCGNDPAAVVGLCRVNCDALWSGYYLCVGV